MGTTYKQYLDLCNHHEFLCGIAHSWCWTRNYLDPPTS